MIKVDLGNFITVGLIAFVFVFLAHRGMKYAGIGSVSAQAA